METEIYKIMRDIEKEIDGEVGEKMENSPPSQEVIGHRTVAALTIIAAELRAIRHSVPGMAADLNAIREDLDERP